MIDPKTKRAEVPEEFTWNLADIFASDEAWYAEYEALKELPARIAAFRGTLGRSAEDLLTWLRLSDEAGVRFEKLMGYAHCKSDQDQANAVYQDMVGKAMASIVAASGASAFATPEILAIDEDTLNLFYIAQPALEEYRRSLYQIRRRAAHILSPEEEKLLLDAAYQARLAEAVAEGAAEFVRLSQDTKKEDGVGPSP